MFHVKHEKTQVVTGTPLTPEGEARLKIFCRFLIAQAQTTNLVARGDLPKLWERHVLDSLQLIPLIPENVASGTDLGSGAGFPGLVLAIATNIPFTLIESRIHKAAFLEAAARLVAAPVVVRHARIEQMRLPRSRLVTARALAPLPRLLALAEPFLARDGAALFLKGRNVDAELTAAAQRWHMHTDRWQSLTDPSASVLRISEIRRGRLPQTAR